MSLLAFNMCIKRFITRIIYHHLQKIFKSESKFAQANLSKHALILASSSRLILIGIVNSRTERKVIRRYYQI
ncbi:hypothetical protein L1887_11301 [Cichorium endivia]|nr:hypothetical protein L1887_11301 [Cichorium endivia]